MRKVIVKSIQQIIFKRKISSLKVIAYLSALYQALTHYNWWLGFYDTLIMIIFYLYRTPCYKKNIKSLDGESYTVWTPKKQRALENNNEIIDGKQAIIHKKHIWICCPGGMGDIDPAMTALYKLKVFKGSKICMFNNPGICTKMINEPLTSPTEPQYLIQYIQYLQNIHNYEVSLIGFSVGSVQALRTLHIINNNQDIDIKLKSVILVHGPDIVREAVISCQNNWFVRMDIYFAFHIRLLQHMSNSWRFIKDKVDKSWLFDGWSFIQQASVASLGKDWDKCEQEMFNMRTFCDKSIESTPVLRIIARNDFIVPFESIDHKYFKYFKDVLISERGGHCGISQCQQTLDAIKKWNADIVETINNENQINQKCGTTIIAG